MMGFGIMMKDIKQATIFDDEFNYDLVIGNNVHWVKLSTIE